MQDWLSNLPQATKGVILLLIIAAVLLLVVGAVLVLLVRPPTPQTDLSSVERSYPQATPQPFRNREEKDTGTLVVTSDIPEVTVLLDATERPDPKDPIPSGQLWPKNTTPFTVERMPVGEHFLFAAKPPQYDTAVIRFEINKDEITRVSIELVPLRTSN